MPWEVAVKLKEEGITYVSASPLGGNLVLLAPLKGVCVLEVLAELKEWTSKIFTSLNPWNSYTVVEERLVWIRCFGLPLHAWNVSGFNLIAKEVY
ncbi:unnamed protein product [Lupinus luteus]|uniref:DUF4283 domain-containing protein n=1 Tax=Lupinus luteus TaxID=3873 RepID=A0AAV1X6M8_LUPLU